MPLLNGTSMTLRKASGSGLRRGAMGGPESSTISLAESRSRRAMTAPRARELAEQPAPPDRLPPRRGGRPSSKIESAACRLVAVRASKRRPPGGAGSARVPPGRRPRSARPLHRRRPRGPARRRGGHAQTEVEHWSATLTRGQNVRGSGGFGTRGGPGRWRSGLGRGFRWRHGGRRRRPATSLPEADPRIFPEADRPLLESRKRPWLEARRQSQCNCQWASKMSHLLECAPCGGQFQTAILTGRP